MSGLFGRRRVKAWNEIVGVPDLADHAQSQAWEPVSGRPFDGHLEDAVHRITISMYIPRRLDTWVRKDTRIGETVYRDSYRTTVDERSVIVTNAWTNIQPEVRGAKDDWKGVAVCAVELPSILPIMCIQPRRFPAVADVRPTATGNASFDETFSVVGAPGFETQVLSDEVQQRIMARDDWIFWPERYLLGCVSKGPFGSASEVSERIHEVLDIVAAIPADVLPTHVDHSNDDLVARVSKLTTMEEAMSFLQQLTPEEREQLAESETPLAAFADVRTPQEAVARLRGMDDQHKMQLFAMFMRVKDMHGRT